MEGTPNAVAWAEGWPNPAGAKGFDAGFAVGAPKGL